MAVITDQIAQAARSMTNRCNSRDPFVIAKALGVRVMLVDDFTNLKGMYRVIKRSRFIFINSTLDKSMRRIVCAHELGHDTLHRESARKDTVQDTMLFGVDSRQEYEANLFAAHLLIDSDEVLEMAKHGYTSQYIAATLSTDVNFISLITDYLIAHGEQLHPQTRKNNILR